MNYTAVTGWFYNNAGNRTAGWTGVEFFYDFLTKNKSAGPYAVENMGQELDRGIFYSWAIKAVFTTVRSLLQ